MVRQPRNDPGESFFARERGLGEREPATLQSQHVVGPRDLNLARFFVVEQDGKPVKVEKRVMVRAGAKINVELLPDSSLALR